MKSNLIDNHQLDLNQRVLRWCPFAGNIPQVNIGREEWLAKQVSQGLLGPIITTYINSKCVVLGRSNKIEQWVYKDRCDEKKIPIIRRMTGGGTVVHHKYNLNYGFILPRSLFVTGNISKPLMIEHFCRDIVISALSYFDINAQATGISDITVNGLKISGNAMWMSKSAILHHGTILFKSYMKEMEYLLPIPPNRDPSLPHKTFVGGLWDLDFIVGPEELANIIALKASHILDLPIDKKTLSRKELFASKSQETLVICRILK